MQANFLVRLNNIHLTYAAGGGSAEVLSGLNLQLGPSELVALIGPSGSGKSTIGKLLLNALPIATNISGFLETPSNSYEAKDWKPDAAGVVTAYVPQEPWTVMSEFSTIGEQLSIYVKEFADRELSDEESRSLVLDLLQKVSLPHAEERLGEYPFNFSGGELQRVAIAMAIAKRAKLIVADEPTASLDPDVRFEIYKLLKDISESEGVSVFLISHDISTSRKFASRVLALANGRAEAWSPEERALSGVPRRKLSSARAVQVFENNLGVVGLSVSFGKSSSREPEPRKVLSDVSFSIARGQVMGLIGPSGSGKTTLGRAITGLVKHQGTIEFNFGRGKQAIDSFVRSKTGYVFQDASVSLNPLMKVVDIVSEPMKIHSRQMNKFQRKQVIENVFGSLELPMRLLDRLPRELSGGERQRVNLARALVLNPSLIIADEPTSALNPELEFEILTKLISIQEQVGFSIIFVSHDMEIMQQFTDQILILDNGQVAEYGKTEEIFANPSSTFLRKALGLNS